MDIFTIIFWVLGISLFIIALKKDKDSSTQAIKKSKSMMGNMIFDIIAVIFLIGLILTLIPIDTIQNTLNSSNTLVSSIFAAIVGSLTLIPAFVAFPLVGSLVDVGAGTVVAVSFLTTLTMVGLVTFPLERKEFGTKFAVTRNSLSFIMAIVIALVMGGILN